MRRWLLHLSLCPKHLILLCISGLMRIVLSIDLCFIWNHSCMVIKSFISLNTNCTNASIGVDDGNSEKVKRIKKIGKDDFIYTCVETLRISYSLLHFKEKIVCYSNTELYGVLRMSYYTKYLLPNPEPFQYSQPCTCKGIFHLQHGCNIIPLRTPSPSKMSLIP